MGLDRWKSFYTIDPVLTIERPINMSPRKSDATRKPVAEFRKAASARPQDKHSRPRAEMTAPTVPVKGKDWSVLDELLKTRTIRIDGEIDENVTAIVTASIDYLEAQNSGDPIHILLNSPGGVVTDGLAIVDRMRNCHCPIHVYATGFVASMASVILVAGNKRYATPNVEIMIHQPWGGADGANQTDMDISANDLRDLREKMTRIYAEETGIPPYHIDKLIERDNYMSADRALKLGLIDEVMTQELYFRMYYNKSVPDYKKPRYPDNIRKGARKTIEEEFNDTVRLAARARNAGIAGNDNKKKKPKSKPAAKPARR